MKEKRVLLALAFCCVGLLVILPPLKAWRDRQREAKRWKQARQQSVLREIDAIYIQNGYWGIESEYKVDLAGGKLWAFHREMLDPNGEPMDRDNYTVRDKGAENEGFTLLGQLEPEKVNVDQEFFEAARTLGANKRQLVFRVAIPHAMPSILQGCTQAMSSSCVALMIAEMLGVKAGLGWYMTWQTGWASYDKVFAALFVICLIFTLVTKVLERIKRYVLRWQNGVEK